jgi:hypothetical protein
MGRIAAAHLAKVEWAAGLGIAFHHDTGDGLGG